MRPIPVPLPVTHATSSEDANFFTPNGTHVPFFLRLMSYRLIRAASC